MASDEKPVVSCWRQRVLTLQAIEAQNMISTLTAQGAYLVMCKTAYVFSLNAAIL